MASNIYKEADKNIFRTWAFMLFFFALVGAIGYFFAYIYQSPGILTIALAFALFMNVFAYWFADSIVLKMHHAYPATREADFDLYTITENLAITAGLPMPKLYIVEDNAPNAFATGRNKDHAVICVTTGLLAILNKEELEGVVAHEMSHIGNRDMALGTIVVVLAGFVTLLSHFFLRSMWFGGGRRNSRDNEAGGILMLVGIVLAILSPIIATLIQLAISRKREFLADADGALLTRYPQGLANALQKIAATGAPMQTANTADAHLFIANPFGPNGKTMNFVQKLFMTHPPVEERIKALVG
ncbi:MAG: Protease HtpX [Parcubacteria group bacterium]|nr:Protease HtpX [Parcubacteria group bacterium]